MKLLKTAVFMGIITLSTQAMTVDGFQTMKFGMTLDEVKKVKKCEWVKYKKAEASWECRSFKFLGESDAKMLATFSGNKLSRVQIIVPDGAVETLAKTLPEKYELSSKLSTSVEGDKTTMTIKYDHDTVILDTIMKGNNEYDYTVLLTYTSDEYLKEQTEKKEKRLEDAKNEL